MNELEEKIEKFHQAVLVGGDFHSVLKEIIEEYGEDSYEKLLAIPDLPEEAGDAQYAITHTVESLADDSYIDLLLRSADKMSTMCPQFLHFLIGRAISSGSCYETLLKKAPEAQKSTVEVVALVVASLKAEAETEMLHDYEKKCKKILMSLDRD